MNILLIHGPNLNMLGKRDASLYGKLTQDELFQILINQFPAFNFTFYQSNFEGEIIEVLHHVFASDYDAILINLGAYTHTSIAIRDALEMIHLPKVEVHLSDLSQREAFRQIDFIEDVCEKKFMGKKEQSYIEALHYLENRYKS